MKTNAVRILSLSLAASMVFSLAACGAEKKAADIPSETVKVMDAYNEEVTVRVNPKRVAILEPSALDILDAAGMENTGIEQLGVQQTESVLPDYLSEYYDDTYVNVGSLFEADYDTLDRSFCALSPVFFRNLIAVSPCPFVLVLLSVACRIQMAAVLIVV